MSAIEPKFWTQLCRVMSLADHWPEADPESWDWRQRQQHGPRLQDQIEAWMRSRPRPAALDELGKRGIPVAAVVHPSEVFEGRSAQELSQCPPAYFNPSGVILPAAPATDAHAEIVRRLRSSAGGRKDELRQGPGSSCPGTTSQ